MVSYFKEGTQVFENRIPRGIFGPKRDASGEWIRLHNKEPNIVRVIKSRRLRWAGRVTRMEEGRSSFKILTDIHTETRLVGVYERTILKWI